MKAKPRTSPTVKDPEDEGGEKGHEVGRQHGPEGAGEAAIDGLADGPARPDLVFEALEVHHVRVHRDADRDDDARHAGEGERQALGRAQQGDDGVEQSPAYGQADHHDEAQSPVVDDHVQQHDHDPADAGQQPGLQRVLADGGRHRLHRLRSEAHRQRAGLQGRRQVAGLLKGERCGRGAADHRGAVEGGCLNGGRRVDNPVKLEGLEALVGGIGRVLLVVRVALRRDLVELRAALAGEVELDLVLARLVDDHRRTGDSAATHVGRPQDITRRGIRGLVVGQNDVRAGLVLVGRGRGYLRGVGGGADGVGVGRRGGTLERHRCT